MSIVNEGIKKKLITLDDDGKYIVYLNENKRRNYSSPEEKVQADTFLALILTYNYPPKRIRQFVKVTMGSEVKEADNPKYLCYILNLYQHQKCFFKLCTNWNNQSGVGVDVLQKIPIPLPPFEKQNAIADHIQTIRDKAKQLRAEAAAGLEQAKREVEAMILGQH